jgi:hypothetical protein
VAILSVYLDLMYLGVFVLPGLIYGFFLVLAIDVEKPFQNFMFPFVSVGIYIFTTLYLSEKLPFTFKEFNWIAMGVTGGVLLSIALVVFKFYKLVYWKFFLLVIIFSAIGSLPLLLLYSGLSGFFFVDLLMAFFLFPLWQTGFAAAIVLGRRKNASGHI